MDNGESSYRRYLEGDDNAFAEIVDLYFDNLTYFVNRYVNDFHASEDIAEDSLLELMIHPKRYNFRVSLKTYLFSIARHKAINHFKHASKITELIDDTVSAGDLKSLEDDVIKTDEKRRLIESIDKLDPEFREAVLLVYFEELSYKDAAKVMKKSVKQIDNLISRAKSKLRTEFTGEKK